MNGGNIDDKSADASAAISLAQITKKYGRVYALSDVSLTVRAGGITAVLGPNGAGKTTLIHQLSGSLGCDSGTVRLAGGDITRHSMVDRVRLGLARSFQITSILDGFTVIENAAMAVQARSGSSFRFLRPASKERRLNDEAMAALARVKLDDRAQRRAGSLSHGEKRQLEIAMALAARGVHIVISYRTSARAAGPAASTARTRRRDVKRRTTERAFR